MLQPDELLPEESLLTKAKSKWIRLYLFTFLAAPVSYGIRILISWELSVWDVGLLYSMLGFIGLISIYNDLGLTDALQYYLPKYLLQKDYARAKGLLQVTMLLQFISWVLIWWVLFLIADWLAITYFDSPWAWWLIKFFWVYFLVVNVFQAFQSFAFAVQNVKLEKTIEFLRMTGVLWCTGILLLTDLLTIDTFALSWMAGLLVATLISAVVFRKKYYHRFFDQPSLITSDDLKAQLSYGFWSLVWSNARTIIAQIDLQLVIVLLGKEMAWYWTNYMSLNSLSTFVFVPLLSFIFPVFTEFAEKWQIQKMKMMKQWLLVAVVVYGVFLGVGVTLFGEWAGVLIFWETYRLSAQLLEYSAFLLFTPLLGIINFQYLRSLWKVRRVSLAQVWVLIFHVFISYAIIVYFDDVFLLAIALLVSHLLFFWVTQWYILRRKL